MLTVEDVVFAVPSYLRSEKQETVDYLRSVGIPKDKIYVFVQTDDDYEKYMKEHGDKCEIVKKDANGVTKARNNILNYFNGGVNLLMMDDDVSCFAVGDKNTSLKDITDEKKFAEIIEKAFQISAMRKGQLFGFYPVYNNFFMSNTVCIKKPVNTVIGIPKGFPYRFNEDYPAKEDIELCGRIMNNGGNIVRINNVTFKAKHRTNKGGCNDVWKSGINEKIARRLSLEYPRIYAVKGNNKQEVRAIATDNVRGIKAWEM